MPIGTGSCSSVTATQYSAAGETSGSSFTPTGDCTSTTYGTTLSGGSQGSWGRTKALAQGRKHPRRAHHEGRH